METVKSLRQKGHKVRVLHGRRTKVGGLFCASGKTGVCEKGGMTRLEITTKNGYELVGEAFCSEHDNYNKKIGVRIALDRAVEQFKDILVRENL